MASRLSFKIDDVDKECECTFYRWQSQQSDPHEKGGESQAGHNQQEYTDADFAREMQGLSFQERQRVTEDVHLGSGQVHEPEEFVSAKVKALIDVIDNHSKKRVQRDAWDRAVFLRPALATDRDHYVLFLRSKSYDAYDAAMQLFRFYEMKRRLWGDELLARRISWEDLSEEMRAVYEGHSCIPLPINKESPNRKVWYYRTSYMDPGVDPLDYVRAMMYFYSYTNEDIQRKGHIVICDLRGPYETIQLLHWPSIISPMMEPQVNTETINRIGHRQDGCPNNLTPNIQQCTRSTCRSALFGREICHDEFRAKCSVQVPP